MKPNLESSDTHDTNDPIEHRLSRMTLRAPSSELDRRVAALLDASAPRVSLSSADGAVTAAAPAITRRSASLIFRVGLPLAACLAVGVTVFFITDRSTPTHDRPAAVADPAHQPLVQPVRFDHTITDAVPGDVVIVDDRLPVVPVQQQSIQRTRWVDPATNTEIEMTVPRQQTLIVPVQLD